MNYNKDIVLHSLKWSIFTDVDQFKIVKYLGNIYMYRLLTLTISVFTETIRDNKRMK